MSQQRGEYTAQRLISLKRHHPRVRQPSAAMSCKQCGACRARLGRPQRVRAHATAAQSHAPRLHIAAQPGFELACSAGDRATMPAMRRVSRLASASTCTGDAPGATLEDKAWMPPPTGWFTGDSDAAAAGEAGVFFARGGSREGSPAVFYLILFGL